MTAPTIKEAYLAIEGLNRDPGQLAVIDRLATLQKDICRSQNTWNSLRRRLPVLGAARPVRGLYLWGAVGRGKTFLMDLFFDTLSHPAKKRIHFHRLMRDVHDRLGKLNKEADPLALVAAQLAREATVLCFDEFFVSDIGDAMILGRLLDGLFQRSVTLVATSNVPPSGLYVGGLQRQRFLPAIKLLEAHTDIVELDNGVDYRFELLQQAGTYLTPADGQAGERLQRFFSSAAAGRIEEKRILEINGRPLETLRCAKGVAWFDFSELCLGPRSQADYIEIARWYHTVIVSSVPALGSYDEDAARRFIALVDEFYDRRVKLVLSAARPAHKLYTGQRLTFEFQRTVSRLMEMQSAEYLQAA
ncbi:MAG: AFG1 family ATPase, partial [Halioglobus sp.]|nr:AFG1 family ATPase [Halioglobus sp.]